MNRKEKNLIIVDNPNGKGEYKLDINTGIVYGLRGKPINSISIQVINFFCDTVKNTELSLAIKSCLNIGGGICNNLQGYSKVLQIADSLDNLSITTNYYYLDYPIVMLRLSNKMNFVKEYSNYVKIQKNNNNVEYDLNKFKLWYDLQKIVKKFNTTLNSNICLLSYNVDYLLGLNKRSTQSFKINFMDNGMFNNTNNQVINMIIEQFQEYHEWCNYLNEKVTTKSNFWTEYKRIKKAYNAQQQKIDKEQFTKAINMHKDEMEFEFGDYQVVIPKNPDDIKKEGLLMHHCVASYAKDCFDFDNPFRSYIVFIRNKNNLDKCYITCEIKNGIIYQYYLAYDNIITREEDKIFKQKYQEHLNKNWIKE